MTKIIIFFTHYCRRWLITDGVRGENCDPSLDANDNVCQDVTQPQCVDRTIRCTALPTNFGNADISVINAPNPDDPTEYGTVIQWTCLGRNHYFNFSVPDDLISFYYSNNINVTTLTCNRDGYERGKSSNIIIFLMYKLNTLILATG